jgi:hypothetical protein
MILNSKQLFIMDSGMLMIYIPQLLSLEQNLPSHTSLITTRSQTIALA